MAKPKRPDEGTRGPNTVDTRRDRQPGGGGKPPKGQPKNPLGNVLPTWDASTGTLNPPTDDPVAKAQRADSAKGRAERRNRQREVLRRQRILRGAGYKVVVDGIWGPISQRSWNDWLRTQGRSQLSESQRRPVGSRSIPVDNSAEQARRIAREKARKEAMRQQAERRAVILAKAALLRESPAAARTFNLRDFTEVMIDRETKLGVQTRAGALATQHFLQSRGYKVKITGRYDESTHEALQTAYRRNQEAEKRNRLTQVRKFFVRAGTAPGDKPTWWTFDGKVPKPGELLAELDSGSFEAKSKLNVLYHQALTGQAAFQQERYKKLFEIASAVQPFETKLRPATLFGKADDWELYLSILGIRDLVPLPDLSGIPTEGALGAAAARAKNQEQGERNAQALGALRAQVNAMFKAKDADDFKRKYHAYVALEEKKFTDFQKRLAHGNETWWGGLVEKVLAPGEFMRTALVYDVMATSQLLLGNDVDVERNVRWEDALRTLGNPVDGLNDYDGLADPANGILRFSFDVTADPLNLAHPFRTLSSGLKYSSRGVRLTRGAALGGYAVKHLGTPAWRTLGTKAFVYEKGTWSKLDVGSSILDSLPHGVRFHETGFAQKAAELARRSAALKDAAVDTAREQVSVMARHGFAAARAVPGMEKVTIRQPRSKRARVALEETSREMEGWIMNSTDLDPLVQGLLKNRVSLFVDASRHEMSQVGAALFANLAEKSRVGAIQQLATASSWDVYDAAIARGVGQERAVQLAAQEEALILESVGVYHIGGSSPSLRRVEFEKKGISKNVAKEIESRVAYRMDELENSFFPALQNILEREADTAYKREQAAAVANAATGGVNEPLRHPLWDEKALWAGRHSPESAELRNLVRQSFDEPVELPNPQFGHAYTHSEFTEALESEIRRRSTRLRWYYSRGVAAESLDADTFNLQDGLQKIREELTTGIDGKPAAWQKRGGKWYDTRETLPASDLYTQHLADLGRDRGAGLLALATGGDLAGLAAMPKVASAVDPLDRGLWRFSWQMGSRYKMRLPGNVPSPTRRFDALPPGHEAAVGQELFDLMNKAIAESSELRRIVDARQEALAAAYDHALPMELRNQLAISQAWQQANNWALKYSYLAISSTLNLWIFATLPLRPGWGVRNIVDNLAKVIVAGVRDPRMLMVGGSKPGAAIASLFDHGLVPVRQMIEWLDSLFGTQMLHHWMILEDHLWQLGSDTLSRIFAAHGVEVSEAVLDSYRLDPFLGKAQRVGRPRVENELKPLATRDLAPGVGDIDGKSFREWAWELMGNRPENYFKRVIYRDTVAKEQKRLAGTGLTEAEIDLQAHAAGWKKVEETLFDYSKISVTEDNFRVFFPFIQFWRKNSAFWLNAFASKPWLSNAVLQFEAERDRAHSDLPDWMRRYFHIEEVTDALAVVPGLEEAFGAMGLSDVMYDPMNFLSFAPMYRAFKSENENLPADQAGARIFGPMLDAVNDWGLGVNPFIRKPLENTGIASNRAWQTVFPQTGVLTALTAKFFDEEMALNVREWEDVFSLFLTDTDSDAIADNFDYWVQTEIANQAARGEAPNLPSAEKVVRAWFLKQNLWGYFSGMYFRRATPEDVYLTKLTMKPFEEMTDKEKDLRKLWGMRGMDRLTFERYVGLLPVIEAYYRAADWDTKQQIKKDNPEIIRWVDPTFRGKPFSENYVQNIQRFVDTANFFEALKIAEGLDLDRATKEGAMSMFKTPGLEAWWKENDTPAEERERMVQAQANQYYQRLNDTYFGLPENDYEARDGFVAAHPELVRFWGRNNDPADDFEAMIGGANAALRDQYFTLVGKKGWDAAAPFLKEFPWMFEWTKSEGKVKDGEWVGGGGGGGKKGWSAERISDFRRAKPKLSWFFQTLMPKIGSKKAWAWLEGSDTEAAKLIRDYLAKYPSEKRVDYMRAEPWLKVFWGMPPAQRAAWLASNAEGAKIVRAYFDKYANEKGMTQHARDYLQAKSELDYYFSLDKAGRREWLKSDDPRAVRVRAYFKKYGQSHKYERAFKKLLAQHPGLADGTPEQVKRLEFWRQLFNLPPDERPNFILQNAEEYGIFVYGEFGEQHQHDAEAEYQRRAVGAGLSERQSAYLYVKPLLDFYQGLDPDEKVLFARANPEIQQYFDRFPASTITGNKQLDKLVEDYFHLPPDSLARSAFLREHPQVQDWFDDRSSPAERAMRTLLEQYFAIQGASEREDFASMHPEIPAYFERRRDEASRETAVFDAFDLADPRLSTFFEQASDMERAAEAMRNRLRQSAENAMTPDTIENRRTRRPLTA